MISIQQMEYILALSEERQFQRASERCFVTQPTLSMQLKKAESLLGAPIFDRSSSPLELTPFGEKMVPVIREVLNEYEQIKVLVHKKSGMFKENIRVGVIPTIAGYLVPDVFDEWQRLLPEVSLSIRELKTEEVLQAMDRREVDLGILAGPVANPKLCSTVLFDEEIYAYTGEEKAAEISSKDLEKMHPWLLTQGNCLRTQMVHFCNLTSDEESWSYEGGNLHLLHKMVRMHGGYTLVPDFAREKGLDGYARIHSGVGEHPARQVIALTLNRSPKWPTMEKLIRDVQLRYARRQSHELQILSWK